MFAFFSLYSLNTRAVKIRLSLSTALLPCICLLLGLAAPANAQEYASSEDRSRFTETPYKKQEPGLLAPSAYVNIAKDAIRHASNKQFRLRTFSDPVVSRRIYRNAPPADRDIVAVQFVYQGDLGGGGLVGPGFIYTRKSLPVPVVQALIRKDGSKVYLNVVTYKNI